MFLNTLKKTNQGLIDACFKLKEQELILPDTYVIDVDCFTSNAKLILDEARKYNIRVYYMLKQLGRNPYLAKILEDLGYDGAVTVDYKEALIMKNNKLKLGNVGHLVQTPKSVLKELMAYGVDVITVYSVAKIKEINEVAKTLGITQDIMIKVYGKDSEFYDGQQSGFDVANLNELLEEIKEFKNINVSGATSFPALLFDEKSNQFTLTKNYEYILNATEYFKNSGYDVKHINTPSANCYDSISLLVGSNEIEPGHALSGTTPYHLNNNNSERVSYAYVSETSHVFKDQTFFYGGGHYRRGHFSKALVGEVDNYKEVNVICPTDDNIDYHFKLEGVYDISKTVVACFRTQIFTTRSEVVLVSGISCDNPKIIARYTAQGIRYE